MAKTRRRNVLIVLLILAIIGILLLMARCLRPTPEPVVPGGGAATRGADTGTPEALTNAPPAPESAEVLTPVVLTAPTRVAAGAAFSVSWTGPDNPGDYVTIVKADASPETFADHETTSRGASLELTAPVEPGVYEVRYVTARSHTVLGRAAITVDPVTASLDAPAEVVLGSTFSVAWTGPGNKGDYVTIVASGAPDDDYGDYVEVEKGPELTLTAPTTVGDAEVRYVLAQGRTVLARRAIKITAAAITMDAPEEATAGSTIEFSWTGPNNAGDYITVVAAGTPDGQYANYTNTSGGSRMKLLMPIMDGAAELRYMAGQGRTVLARRAIRIVPAVVTLSAPPQCAPGDDVGVEWTGPDNAGDYITIVTKVTPDGQYAAYANTSQGSPARVKAPTDIGDCEIRYMSGQGGKVLGRISIRVVP